MKGIIQENSIAMYPSTLKIIYLEKVLKNDTNISLQQEKLYNLFFYLDNENGNSFVATFLGVGTVPN